MKHYLRPLCLALAILICNPGYSKDLPQGSMSIGGQSSYFSFGEVELENGNSTTSYGFGASMGYFISQNLEVGAGFSYSRSESDTGLSSTGSRQYSIAPFFTKHIPVSKTNNFILTGGINYIKRTSSSGTDSSHKSWQVGAGVMHFFTGSVATSITFNHLEIIDADGSYIEYEQTYVDIGLKLFF